MAGTSTSRTQRTFIWIIAIVMAAGTLGSFFIFMLPKSNEPVKTQAQIDFEKQAADYEKAQAEHIASLKPLDGYEAQAFDPASVTELKIETLKEGDGNVASATSTLTANYFGWTSDGKIFDSTNVAGKVTPVDFSLEKVIEGWTEGMTGSKVGEVRKLTIPAIKAYGDQPAGGNPAGPLTFIVEVVAVK